MGKQWVQFMLFVSLLVLPLSSASERISHEKLLTDKELEYPEFVVNWLKTEGANADMAMVGKSFQYGLKAKQQGRWGPAGKAFGESMIRYPSPQAIAEYINAELHDLGAVRAREKTVNRFKRKDMIHARKYYRSALAANTVTNTLSSEEKTQLQGNIQCLDYFIRFGKVQPTCRPLQAYGLIK
jgi:hypothetical protein